MRYIWTWSGKFFGYLDHSNLWTRDGRHVGKAYGSEIYDTKGFYLGELKAQNRLIRAINKANCRKQPSQSLPNRMGIVGFSGYVGYCTLMGFEDFPEY